MNAENAAMDPVLSATGVHPQVWNGICRKLLDIEAGEAHSPPGEGVGHRKRRGTEHHDHRLASSFDPAGLRNYLTVA